MNFKSGDRMMAENRIRLRAELFKCAARGHFPTYNEMLPHLTPSIQQGWRPEWSGDLNQISMEEQSHGYPDITFILHRADPNSPYPSQINFRDSHKPDAAQLDSLRKGTDEIIKLYCPSGTKNPYY
jgi:hypothetical protein